MAINKHHEFEELNGVKCGIVEKMVPGERVLFLQELLQHNGYTVVVVPSPPPKAATPAQGEEAAPAAAETFTVGVTDYTFNPINAIFGRALKTVNGKVVTLAYWRQEDMLSREEVPYFQQ